METLKGPPRGFKGFVIFVLVIILLVVVAGGVVRATGSGMGCPDWPLCFGLLIPPTSVDQLPADYETKYAVDGNPAVFNALKTWIEYINRLFGLLSGFLTLAMVVWAAFFIKRRPSVLIMSAIILVGLLIEAWLGKKVVEAYLAHSAVTLHMIVALIIVVVHIALIENIRRWKARANAQNEEFGIGPLSITLWTLLFLAAVSQLFLGISIREQFEAMTWNETLPDSHYWLEPWGGSYTIHQISAGVLGLCSLVFMFYHLLAKNQQKWAKVNASLIAGFVGLEALVGIIIHSLNVPDWPKPIHLTLSFLLFLFLTRHLVRSLRFGTKK